MYKALVPTTPSSKQLTQKHVSKENQLNQTESSDGTFAVKSVLWKKQRKETEEVECMGTNINEAKKKLMDRGGEDKRASQESL